MAARKRKQAEQQDAPAPAQDAGSRAAKMKKAMAEALAKLA